MFANTPVLFQSCSGFVIANPLTFEGKMERRPVDCNKRKTTREIVFLVSGGTSAGFYIIKPSITYHCGNVKEILLLPPYSFCPILIHSEWILSFIEFMSCTWMLPLNRIISFIGIADLVKYLFITLCIISRHRKEKINSELLSISSVVLHDPASNKKV